MTALETQLLLARATLLILLYTFLGAVGLVAWLDLRHARRAAGPSGTLASQARLIVLGPGESDRAPGSAFGLAPVTSIGRDLDNDIVLADATVSGRHAVLSRHDGAWWIEDFASTNGTHVNDRAVHPGAPEVLRSGDVIQLGGVRLRIAAVDE